MSTGGIIDNIISPNVEKQIKDLAAGLDVILGKIEQIGLTGGKMNLDFKAVKSMGEMIDLQKQLAKLEEDAQKTAEKINAERKKGYDLIEKQVQKEKEKKEKENAKEAEAAMKKLNAESEKRLKAIEKEAAALQKKADTAAKAQQKETDYLKKHGEETTKLTRTVEALRVKTQELILTKGKENAVTIQSQKEYDAAKKKLTDLQQTMGNHTQDVGRYGKAWDGVKGAFLAVTGAIAAASGAIKFTKDAMESTGAGADYLAKKIGGVKEGYHQFMVAIQTGDFSNLVTKMRDAIEEGERYIETLDKVRDATTAVSIKQVNLKVELEKLKTTERDNSKGKLAQIAAGKRGIEIENQLLKENMDLANMAFENEKKHVQQKTGLGFATISAALKGEDPNDPNYRKYQSAKKYLEIQTKIDKFPGTGNIAADKAIFEDWKKEMTALGKEAEVTAGVIKKMNILTKDGADGEVPKLKAAWVNLGNVQTDNISNRRRLEIKLGNLKKGILDDAEKEDDKNAKESVKTAKEAAKEKEKTEKEFWENIKKESDQAAKEYDDAVKIQLELDKKANELRLKYGLETDDELLRIEIEKTTKAAEFAELTTKQKADALVRIYQDTLRKLAKEGSFAATTEDFNPPVVDQGTPVGVSLDPADTDKNRKSKLEKERKEWEERLQMTQHFVSAIQSLVNSMYSNQFAKLDEASTADEAAKQRELAAAGDNKKKQDEINAKYAAKEAARDKERKKALHDQAVYNKALAVTQVIISTALGAMQAYAQLGPIGGTAGALLVAAAGVIELAAVLAQNIPSYKTGRKGGPAEFAKVHEGELIRYPGGSIIPTPRGETTTLLPQGADVITKSEAEKFRFNIIPAGEVLEAAGRFATPPLNHFPEYPKGEKLGEILNQQLAEMRKKKPETRISIDGKFTVEQTGNYTWRHESKQ